MAFRVWSCLVLLDVARAILGAASGVMFDQNYEVAWGGDHAANMDGKEIHLSMDKTSGAGFGSKSNYGSGFFHMKIKLPNKDSSGVVTAYYLSSNTANHDELDFEFLGNKQGKQIILQTNIFTKGVGNREQRISLWFDPTADFHDYKILWNRCQVVFFVDQTPIRVFKNLTSHGVGYPSQVMKIVASLWDGEDWATDGGRAKTNWSQAPFTAQFQGFDIDGCANNAAQPCDSPALWWNRGTYTQLTSAQRAAYEGVKNNFMIYDYCTDKGRYPTPPRECVV